MIFPAQIKNLILKLFIFSIFYLLFSIFLAFPAHAQEQNAVINQLLSNTNPDVPKDLSTLTQTVTIEALSSLGCLLGGINPANPGKGCLGYDETTKKIGYVQQNGGVSGTLGGMMVGMYTLPVSSGDYIQYLAGNFGLAKTAYAQGIGFQRFKPLLDLWKGFRNVVYLFFTAVFVLIGLAIMLRIKIDPRTVMTIENQIPKIIIGIILVTFSYAIAGFLVDMMYLTIYLVMGVVDSAAPGTIDFSAINASLQQPPFLALNSYYSLAFKDLPIINQIPLLRDTNLNNLGLTFIVFWPSFTIGKIIADIFSDLTSSFPLLAIQLINAPFLYPITICNIINSNTPIISGALSGLKDVMACSIIGKTTSAGLVAGTLGGMLAYIIISIAVLWALFRLWFQLLSAYIFIILDVVFVPFWILGGLIPGSPGFSFGGWLRDIIANLSAFPTTIAMFLLGKVFIDYAVKSSNFLDPNKQSLFVPPLIGNPSDPNMLAALFGLGVIFLTPQVVNIMKDAIKSPKFPYLSAIGQPVAAGGAIVGGTTRRSTGAIYAHQAGTLPRAGETGIQSVFRYFMPR